ncbi:hypothetical protein [Streptomyces sp. NPDC046976]|uniref:hypothetical protein n=1 Tax=Streptomyces sp. NPDC046976 TaxID=3155258 RepID=UPI0033EE72A8
MQLRLFADYFQVCILDGQSAAGLVEVWTPESLADRVAISGDSLTVRTEVNVDVEVNVGWTATPPVLDVNLFDHVVEVSLEIASGEMVIMGCTDYSPDAFRMKVWPGWVRLRIQKSNLKNAVLADLESDESPETIERIRIDAWPEKPSSLRVMKRWQGVGG